MQPTSSTKLHTFKFIGYGLLIGCADVIPGISGATIALLFGIYPRLIAALSRLGWRTVGDFFSIPWRLWWKRYDLGFLFPLGLGIGCAVLLLARLLHLLFTHYPVQTYAFLLGLIAAAGYHLLRRFARARILWWGLFLCGILAGLGVNRIGALALDAPIHWYVYFISGLVAIGVMLLPGISGAMVLLSLGTYPLIIAAIATPQPLPLAIFIGGVLSGLLLFPRVLQWLFSHYQDLLMAILLGLLSVSLIHLWPWDTEGRAILPEGTQLTIGLWLIIGGVMVMVLGYHVAMRIENINRYE